MLLEFVYFENSGMIFETGLVLSDIFIILWHD